MLGPVHAMSSWAPGEGRGGRTWPNPSSVSRRPVCEDADQVPAWDSAGRLGDKKGHGPGRRPSRVSLRKEEIVARIVCTYFTHAGEDAEERIS